ncbi:hypothetical protein ARTHROSP310_28460 [Arthrobacter sp. AD-310]
MLIFDMAMVFSRVLTRRERGKERTPLPGRQAEITAIATSLLVQQPKLKLMYLHSGSGVPETVVSGRVRRSVALPAIASPGYAARSNQPQAG